MFILSLNSFIEWHQLQGTIGEKQYFILTCTEGYTYSTNMDFGMDQTTRTGFGTWIYICLYINFYIYDVIKQISNPRITMQTTEHHQTWICTHTH